MTTPSVLNAGCNDASFSSDVSRRGVSSTAKRTTAPPAPTSTGMISFSNLPSSVAATARRCDSSEYSSSDSRVRFHSSAITSAEIPCGTMGQRSPIFSFTAPQPMSPRFDPIGTRVMCSTPAAMTTSRCPACTVDAALNAVCSDEPHCRSTVVAHTVSGQPATRTAPRPTFRACSPTWVTQPICTSSTSPGSRSTRPTSPFRTCAASSSARISESEPFRLPIGERTASTT